MIDHLTKCILYLFLQYYNITFKQNNKSEMDQTALPPFSSIEPSNTNNECTIHMDCSTGYNQNCGNQNQCSTFISPVRLTSFSETSSNQSCLPSTSENDYHMIIQSMLSFMKIPSIYFNGPLVVSIWLDSVSQVLIVNIEER